jgi:hypothetical protein
MGGSTSVVDAIVVAALRATFAAATRVLASDGDRLQTVAIAGTGPGWRLGEVVAADAGTFGYVLASGQPLFGSDA